MEIGYKLVPKDYIRKISDTWGKPLEESLNEEEMTHEFIDLIKSCQTFYQSSQFKILIDHLFNISRLLLSKHKQCIEIISRLHFLEFIHDIFLQNIECINDSILCFIISYTYVTDLPNPILLNPPFFSILNRHLASGSYLAFHAFGNIIPIIGKTNFSQLLSQIEPQNLIQHLYSTDMCVVEMSLFCICNLILYSTTDNISELIPILKDVLNKRDDISNQCIKYISRTISQIVELGIEQYSIILNSSLFHSLSVFLTSPDYNESHQTIFECFDSITSFLFKLKKQNIQKDFVEFQIQIFFVSDDSIFPLKNLNQFFKLKIPNELVIDMIRKSIKANNGQFKDMKEYQIMLDNVLSLLRNGPFKLKEHILRLIYSLFLGCTNECCLIAVKMNVIIDLVDALQINDLEILNITLKTIAMSLHRFPLLIDNFKENGIENILKTIYDSEDEIENSLYGLTELFVVEEENSK